jgi:tRNA(fMet)-specific endonuclease VapC
LKYLLDTNILIFLDKGQGNCLEKVSQQSPHDVVLCTISLMELEYGMARSARPERLQKLLQVMRIRHRVIDFDSQAAAQAGRLKAFLASSGLPIGPYDLQIAGIALAHKLTVVTHNTTEFSRVPGLQVEDWYA